MSTVSHGIRPSPLQLKHVALNVADLRACERFYCEILGLHVVWRPDDRNVYLTTGSDNLALHQAPGGRRSAPQSLDHIGFVWPSGEVESLPPLPKVEVAARLLDRIRTLREERS